MKHFDNNGNPIPAPPSPQYWIWFVNFYYSYGRNFHTKDEAIDMMLSRGFEATVYHGDTPIAYFHPVTGLKVY